MKQPTIAIIGTGRVGSTTAYALILKNTPAHIILVDINEIRCKGEVLDLSDSLPFSKTPSITQGTLAEAGQADIIIIAAGIAQKPGQSRLELLQTNRKVIASIIKATSPIKKSSIILVISNPLDLLTLQAQELAGLPRAQIIGSGTFLDSHRLRSLIANKLNIAEQSIDVYILGEHGETQFPLWSQAHINGTPLLQFPGINEKDLEHFAQETRNKAAAIIGCKEATYYGIATCAAELCDIIVHDAKKTVPVSCYIESLGVCLSMPVILGARGIERMIPISLNQKEQQSLEISAALLKKSL